MRKTYTMIHALLSMHHWFEASAVYFGGVTRARYVKGGRMVTVLKFDNEPYPRVKATR